MTTLFVAWLVTCAALLWPRRRLPWLPDGPTPGAGRPTGRGDASPVLARIPALAARLRAPDRAERLAEEAAYAELLALALRAGLPPSAALSIADPDHPPARAEPLRGGALLARAWAQSEALGTPMAEAVATCAAARQSDHDHELRRRAAAAGPRASMLVLTALPVAGPLLASLVGLGPQVDDPVVLGLLCSGFGATACGWWWARRLVARADRPVRVARPSGGLR